MIKILSCKKCDNKIKIDYSKAPANEFTIGCPSCQQKYRLTNPIKTSNNDKVPTPNLQPSTKKIGTVTCKKCNSKVNFQTDASSQFPEQVVCQNCSTKINLVKSEQKGKPSQVPKIDKEKIDPKNNWAYKVYYHTRKISYLNKFTLFIYLLYLTRSITKSLSNIELGNIDLESFLKLKAEANTVSNHVFNTSVNPVLKENNISPSLLSWATTWFVKKVSTRIVMNVLELKKVDKNIPYIKKYLDEIKNDNSKILLFLTSDWIFAFYIVAFSIIPFLEVWDIVDFPLFFIWLLIPIPLARYKNLNLTTSVFTQNLLYGVLHYFLFREIWDASLFVDDENLFSSSWEYYFYKSFYVAANFYVVLFFVLAVSAYFFDYKKSKGSKESKFQNSWLFKKWFLPVVITSLYLAFFTYSTTTKHNVTRDEYSTFAKNNLDLINGTWYFLNADSTEIEELSINSSSSNMNTDASDGIISSNMFAVCTEIDGQQEVLVNTMYNENISFPINFDNDFLQLTSISKDKITGSYRLPSGEKVNFIGLKDGEILRKEIKSYFNEFNEIELSGQFSVITENTEVYLEPSFEYSQGIFLKIGDSGTFSRRENGFILISQTINDVYVEGWISENNVTFN